MSSPSEVKANIRSRKKAWFDAKDGARGWIVGPFICLWFSAFDRYGPMLFGRISRADLGTKVSGRAGSDLNGLLVFSILLPFMAWLLYEIIAAGDYAVRQVVIISGVLLLSPLLFWWSHKDRKEAEPLVRFLRDAVTPAGRATRARAGSKTTYTDLKLTISGEDHDGPLTTDAIHEALLGVGPDGFVVLEAQPEAYIQTAFRDGGYVLEKRDGSAQDHFEAVRNGFADRSEPERSTFAFEEVREAFLAYAAGSAMPSFIGWKRMQLAA